MTPQKKSSELDIKSNKNPAAMDVISAYVTALAAGNSKGMERLRASDFVLDWVHGDAFEDDPVSKEYADRFWPAWFAAFPEMDYEVTRTIVAEQVVVTQWTFTGVHTGILDEPIMSPPIQPTGRVIRLRGVSIFDIAEGLIQRETAYLDFATLMVELGAGL